MAYGGIAVSGGTTGHGTLIHTNLLYSPLLLDSNRNPLARPAFTLGGTAGAAGYEAAFLVDMDQASLFKTAASDNDISVTIDLGSGNINSVYGVVLIGHNLTEDNVDDATDSFALAKFEGGPTTACGLIDENLTINALKLTPAYKLLDTPANHRYWRVRVNFNASTAFQIGELFLVGAAPLAFTKNYNKAYSEALELGKSVNDGYGGVPRHYVRWERKRFNMAFEMIPTAQLEGMQAAARNGLVVFSPQGASSYAYFGLWELEEPRYRFNDRWDVTAHFTESAR